MQVKLLYHTPNYHKLVETVARVCYQSYEKDAPNSHNFIKAIMAKGHISVASVGNLVFEVTEVTPAIRTFLLEAHEITQFIKWSIMKPEENTYFYCLVSMNMLTFLDIYNKQHELSLTGNYVFQYLVQQLDNIPYLKWFYDKSVQLEESPNEYTAKGTPSLYEPIILDEDYTVLKALGMNDYELGIHAQITMNFITDRSAGLQFWRHWAGGCELSQRYVERGNAEFRDMVGLEQIITDYVNEHTGDVLAQQKALGLKATMFNTQKRTMNDYEYILKVCAEIGIRANRSKEIARSILPNSITTQIIQSRPYRNWKHLFNLRDTTHAQAEIREDVRAMKQVLADMDVIQKGCEMY